MSRKLSMLFWCGLFVAVLGSFLLITNLFNLIIIYRFSLSAQYLGLIIARSVFFVALYALLVAAGVYVTKKGITKVQPPPVEQPANVPAP